MSSNKFIVGLLIWLSLIAPVRSQGMFMLAQQPTQVAVGSMIMNDHLTFGATSQQEACARFIAGPSGITTASFAIPTWWNSDGTGLENANGGTAQVNLTIEYPIGTVIATPTFVGVTGSPALPATLPDNANNFSDPVTLNMPAGAVGLVHMFWSSANGFVLNNSNDTGSPIINQASRDQLNGEKYRQAASGLTMQALCSSITNSEAVGQIGWRPVAIVGTPAQRSFGWLGDSRSIGYTDLFSDTTLNLGYARSSGNIPNINTSVFGLATGVWLSSHARKMELLNRTTDIIFELGTNDITNSPASVTTFLANQQTILALFPGKRFYSLTLPGASTSTDAFLTVGNQTGSSKNPNITTYNNLLRTGAIAGIRGYSEFANVSSSSPDSGLWRVDGITAQYTATISGTVMNVSAMASGTINNFDMVGGAACGTQIVSFGTGIGQTGTYNISKTQTVASSTTMFSNPPTCDGAHEFWQLNGKYPKFNLQNFNFLLKRDIDPASNDNDPVFLEKAS